MTHAIIFPQSRFSPCYYGNADRPNDTTPICLGNATKLGNMHQHVQSIYPTFSVAEGLRFGVSGPQGERVELEESSNRLALRFKDGSTAYADYQLLPGRMGKPDEKSSGRTLDITYVFTPDHHREQGVGSVLCESALQLCRARSYNVSASCGFARNFLSENAERSGFVKVAAEATTGDVWRPTYSHASTELAP